MSRQPVTGGGHLLDLVNVAGRGRLLRVVVPHDEDVPPAGGRDEGLDGLGGHLGQDRRVPRAEVAAAAFRAGQLGPTVMVMDALGRGPPQLVVVLKVICHIGKVRGGPRASEGAQLVMRRLKHLLEDRLVTVRLPVDIFFTRLFDLHNDRNDNKDDHNAGSHANDSPTGVGELVQQAGFPLFFTMIFIPRIHTVLESVAHQRVVNTHVAVAEESVAFTGRFLEGREEHLKPAVPTALIRPHADDPQAGAQHDVIGHCAAELGSQVLHGAAAVVHRHEVPFALIGILHLIVQEA